MGAYIKLEIGEVYKGMVSDGHGKVHMATYRVMREATQEEWEAWCKEADTDMAEKAKWKVKPGARFYEIHTD